MIRIKVQYDALNRTFKLVDAEFTTILDAEELYDLNVPIMYEEINADEFVPPANVFIAHA
jgi:hypothetical protein